MNLERAVERIKECANRMNSAYGKAVFDEWALISIEAAKAKVLAYSGPRKEDFHDHLAADLGALRGELLGKKHPPGHFEFAGRAHGTRIEAFLAAGDAVYLLCNNTARTMEQITAEERWLQAQVHFAELAEEFHQDPCNG